MRRFSKTKSAKIQCLLATVAVFGLLTVLPVRAQERDTAGAAAAYQHAQQADLRGEHARAAELYELADRLVPASAALRSAARARLLAGQLASAAAHAELLRARDPNDARSQALADDILTQAQRELVRVLVTCRPDCVVALDGVVVNPQAAAQHAIYARAGQHRFVAHFGQQRTALHQADLQLGTQPAFELSAPTVEPAAPEAAQASVAHRPVAPRERGLSPLYGLGMGGVALALGAVTIWSRVDTENARDQFIKEPTRAAFHEGEQKDRRTQLLLGSSAVAAVASAVLLVLADFRSDERLSQRAAERLTRRTDLSLLAGRHVGVQLRHSF